MKPNFDSLRKRWYTKRLSSKRCAKQWADPYWAEDGTTRSITCSRCPKLSPDKSQCSIPFGTPLRKCVVAAQEAHLHSLTGKNVLEVGFGKHSIPRRLVHSAGGTWTGIDPFSQTKVNAQIGKEGFGCVAAIPFPDATFDVVAGIQTFEHWDEPLPRPDLPIGHTNGLNEIHRVLKPDGWLYLDAPMHLHGHEMCIAGDVERIRSLFDLTLWQNVIIEKWRLDHEPLERYAPPETDRIHWKDSVTTYDNAMLKEIAEKCSVWLLTITATKKSEL